MSSTVELPAEVLRARVGTLLGAPVAELRRLPGGASGLTYIALVGADRHDVVVKVAPAGIPAVGNRDVLRQARVLRFLGDAGGVRVPTVLAEDPGEGVEIPPLFVMSFVRGASVEPLQEPGWTSSRADMAGRAHAAVEMLAAMHDRGSAPGEQPMTIEAEVGRWARAFASVPESLSAGFELCRDGLLAALPSAVRATVVHGDWRLGNMICVGPRVEAVIDWEIWAVGDPRGDLGWLMLAMDPEHPCAVVDAPDLPGPQELLASYERVAGPVADVQWFAALQRYKQAAILALLVKNARKMDPRHPFSVTYTPVIRQLLDWSARLLAG